MKWLTEVLEMVMNDTGQSIEPGMTDKIVRAYDTVELEAIDGYLGTLTSEGRRELAAGEYTVARKLIDVCPYPKTLDLLLGDAS